MLHLHSLVIALKKQTILAIRRNNRYNFPNNSTNKNDRPKYD